jgi:hypothetical protein
MKNSFLLSVTEVSAGIRSGCGLSFGRRIDRTYAVKRRLSWIGAVSGKERIARPEHAMWCRRILKEVRFDEGPGREGETGGPLAPHHTHSTALNNNFDAEEPVSAKRR